MCEISTAMSVELLIGWYEIFNDFVVGYLYFFQLRDVANSHYVVRLNINYVFSIRF